MSTYTCNFPGSSPSDSFANDDGTINLVEEESRFLKKKLKKSKKKRKKSKKKNKELEEELKRYKAVKDQPKYHDCSSHCPYQNPPVSSNDYEPQPQSRFLSWIKSFKKEISNVVKTAVSAFATAFAASLVRESQKDIRKFLANLVGHNNEACSS